MSGAEPCTASKTAHVIADVRARHDAEPADQPRAQVAQHVAVEVLEQEHVEARGILHQRHAARVDDHLLVVDLGELGVVHRPRAADEHPVGELHDVGLVEDGDLLAPALARVAEAPARDARAGLLGGHLDGGHHPGRQRGLDAAVEALGVLADDHEIHPAEAGRHAVEIAHRPHRRVEVELLAQPHVDRGEALADRRGARPLERDLVAGDRVQRLARAARPGPARARPGPRGPPPTRPARPPRRGCGGPRRSPPARCRRRG